MIDDDGTARRIFSNLDQFVRRIRCIDVHQCTGRGQQFGLPGRSRTPASHDGAFVVERQKNWKTSQ